MLYKIILKLQDGGYIWEGFNGFYFSGSVLGNQEFYQIILLLFSLISQIIDLM